MLLLRYGCSAGRRVRPGALQHNRQTTRHVHRSRPLNTDALTRRARASISARISSPSSRGPLLPLCYRYSSTSSNLPFGASEPPNKGQYGVQEWTEHAAQEWEKGIAVLGGGITGLSTAYYLSNAFPHRPITLYEGSPNTGGWIKTDTVEVDHGQILFDTGPKTLRPDAPNGALTLRLVQDLDLLAEFLPTFKDEPAAKNRFFYYPDHLVLMPSSSMSRLRALWQLWSEPVFDKVLTAILYEWSVPRRPQEVRDESVASFLARRLHPALAENIASAGCHGIYAGDVNQLSARQILGSLWMRETKFDSLAESFHSQIFHKSTWKFCDDLELTIRLRRKGLEQKYLEMSQACSVFSFKKGMSTLSAALEEELKSRSNVTIAKNTPIGSISKHKDSDDLIIRKANEANEAGSSREESYHHVISTIPSKNFLPMIRDDLEKAHNREDLTALESSIGSIHAVTVGVVNLYYNTPSMLTNLNPPGGLPPTISSTGIRGFGYLIPASIPAEQNPECALGVQFDSDITPDLHTSVPSDKLGTKLTVMMGGHWWDGLPEMYSNKDDLADRAKAVLRRHLGITEEPAYIKVNLWEQCIPQYTVGHGERMEQAHEALWHQYKGRLRVAGSSYTGVGVNDCIRAGWETAEGLREEVEGKGAKSHLRRTGLEKFVDGDRPMALVEASGGPHMTIKQYDIKAEQLGFFETLQEILPKPRPRQ